MIAILVILAASFIAALFAVAAQIGATKLSRIEHPTTLLHCGWPECPCARGRACKVTL